MSNAVLIKIKRGTEAQLPTLAEGELGFCIDSQKLYIGTTTGNKLLVASQAVGDMLKSIYDTNNDGKVDSAEKADSVPWSGVTGKPSTFNPDSHVHSAGDISEITNKRFMTDAERSKLAGIATEANKYIHPSTHPVSMITGLASVATTADFYHLKNRPNLNEFFKLQTGESVNINNQNGTKLFVGSSENWINKGPSAAYSNAFLSLNTFPGNYYSQLWFDTYTDELYHRTIHQGELRPWRKIWHAGNLTNLNQLANGPGFITSSDSITGNAATASKLQTARKINGVAFDGTKDITITATPSAHTHTKSQISDFPSLATVATSGSYNDLLNKPTIPTQTSQLNNNSGFITASSNISGNAATATKLQTARKINGVAFDGTADININVSGGAKVEQGYYYGNGESYRSIYFDMSDPCLLFILVNSGNADGANGIYQAVYTNLLKEQVMSAGIYCATPFDNGGILMGTRVGALNLSYFQVTTTAALNKSGVYYEYIVVGN